jgi:hypothetical protein
MSSSYESVKMNNLVEKKQYRTFMSSCFDVNTSASRSNTLALQPNLLSTTVGATGDNDINLTSAQLSLIVAAGFNKGEIHVFDAFKKEASIFYNSNVIFL